MEILTGRRPASFRIVIYGTPGIGKSTLASYAPRPLFMDLEGGLNQIDCHRTLRCTSWMDCIESMQIVAETDTYDTLVIDTISAMDSVLTRKINDENPKQPKNLAQWGWQTGFEVLAASWSLFLKHLDVLQEKHGKNVILVGHSTIQKMEDPTSDPYDRYTIDTHKKNIPVIVNNADAVLFARHDLIVKEKENSKRLRAIPTGERFLHCLESPAYVAKNRFGLPEKVKMHPEVYDMIAGKVPK